MAKPTLRQKLWTAELENRLIEMCRTQHTLVEMARELSLPIDEIEERIEELALEGDLPRGYC